MKKFLFGLFTLIMTIMTSVCFVSCGDDDEADSPSVINSAIVGKWYLHRSGYTLGREYRANGQYYSAEIEDGENPDDCWGHGGTWSVDGDVLTVNKKADEEKPARVKLYDFSVSEDGATLYLMDREDGGSASVWTRKL
jgi:hypothetical protein